MSLKLPPFTYHTPGTVDEAVTLLAEPDIVTAVVAGGTDLLPKMKRKQVTPTALVSLSQIDSMNHISIDGEGRCVIGASTTLAEIINSPLVPSALASAAQEIASPSIRNTATAGGNLCLDTRCNYIDMPENWRDASGHCLKDGGETCWVAPRGDRCWAISSTDLAPVVVALNGSVRLASIRGERLIPASDLYRNDGMDHLELQADELLVEVILPPFTGRAVYHKLRRRGAIDFPLVGVACAVTMNEDGSCAEARIVVGGVAPAPMRAAEAEDLLKGAQLTETVIEEAAKLASGPLRPQDNTDMGSRYRKWMIPVVVGRALTDAAHNGPDETS